MSFIYLGLALSSHHGQGIHGQGRHLIFSRVAVCGSQEGNALAYSCGDIFRARHSSCQQYGIDVAAEHGALGSDVFSHMVNHRIDNKLGVLVSVGNTLLYLLHVVGSQMCRQSSLSGNTLQELLLGVLPAEAQLYQVCRRQRACPLRRERPLTV